VAVMSAVRTSVAADATSVDRRSVRLRNRVSIAIVLSLSGPCEPVAAATR
jgi:hypothetical protein